MPKCLLYSARDYRTGNYFGGQGHNTEVMTTRSGLSIKKIPGSKSITNTRTIPNAPPSPSALTKERGKNRKKHRHKSLSYMSFVTRYYLCVRVPEFDLAGFSTWNRTTGCRQSDLYKEYGYLNALDSDFDVSDDDDDGDMKTSDDDDTASLDRFILHTADDMNNNHQIQDNEHLATGKTDNLEQNEDGQITSISGSINSSSCPLVKFFSTHRLTHDPTFSPKINYHQTTYDSNQSVAHLQLNDVNPLSFCNGPEINSCSPDYIYKASQDEIDTIRAAVESDNESSQETFGNDTVFITASELDSEDASSICSDMVDAEGGMTSSVTRDGDSPSCIHHTRTIRLRDVQLTLNVIDLAGGQKVIKCSECDQVFIDVSSYVPHLKTHMKSKNKCFLCGKMFSRSWLLKGHMRTHTGEKPFPCPHEDCNKAFADKSNLRSHLMTHSGSKKDYRCEKCGRAFAQKRYLHKHNLESKQDCGRAR